MDNVRLELVDGLGRPIRPGVLSEGRKRIAKLSSIRLEVENDKDVIVLTIILV